MKCQFEQDGFCHALACYSKQKCGARDKKGQSKYSSAGGIELGSEIGMKDKWFRTKLIIGFSILTGAGILVAWSIYQMVLIHQFIMGL